MRALTLLALATAAASLPPGGAASTPAPGTTAAAQRPGQSDVCRAAIAQVEREAGLPPRLLAAIARVESGRRDPETGAFGPWPWTINAEGRGSFFPDKAAAVAGVRAQQAMGVRSIDVGCMQINLRHHPNAFASLEEAFDPLTNVRYAARFLSELQATRGDWMRSAGHYHSQTPEFAEPYRARVAAAWEAERALPATALVASAAPRAAPPTPLRPGAVAGGAGAALLSNGGDRAPVLPVGGLGGGGGGGGRGLDAYRSAPIALAGRTPPLFAAAAPAARPAASPPPAAPPLLFLFGAPPAAARAAPAASPGRS